MWAHEPQPHHLHAPRWAPGCLPVLLAWGRSQVKVKIELEPVDQDDLALIRALVGQLTQLGEQPEDEPTEEDLKRYIV